MNITVQTLKDFFSRQTPWEVDFRDVSIETKVTLSLVKKIGGIVFPILTVILGIWLGSNIIKGRSLDGVLNEIQLYITNNEAKNENLLKLNRDFYEERDSIALLVNTYSDKFDIQKFLQDLIQNKSGKIKFGEIVVKKEKRDLKQQDINLTIRLDGWVNGEISLVESMRHAILKYPSLGQVPNCKSFFQLDQGIKGFQKEEIKFQLNIQSNE